MKIKYFLLVALLSLFSLGAQAAGSPLNESFTNLIALSNNAIEVGKAGDAQAFVESIRTALEALGEQNDKGSSIRLQRASAKMKKALKAGKADNLPQGIANLEKAIAEMQK
ncbi:MAG: hypothetical protein ACU836_17105 [Gammaproteobacteria bacterium]